MHAASSRLMTNATESTWGTLSVAGLQAGNVPLEQALVLYCYVANCTLCSNCVLGSMRLKTHLLNLTREAALLTGTVLPLAAFPR